jgi:hypothetical protein
MLCAPIADKLFEKIAQQVNIFVNSRFKLAVARDMYYSQEG